MAKKWEETPKYLIKATLVVMYHLVTQLKALNGGNFKSLDTQKLNKDKHIFFCKMYTIQKTIISALQAVEIIIFTKEQ